MSRYSPFDRRHHRRKERTAGHLVPLLIEGNAEDVRRKPLAHFLRALHNLKAHQSACRLYESGASN